MNHQAMLTSHFQRKQRQIREKYEMCKKYQQTWRLTSWLCLYSVLSDFLAGNINCCMSGVRFPTYLLFDTICPNLQGILIFLALVLPVQDFMRVVMHLPGNVLVLLSGDTVMLTSLHYRSHMEYLLAIDTPRGRLSLLSATFTIT